MKWLSHWKYNTIVECCICKKKKENISKYNEKWRIKGKFDFNPGKKLKMNELVFEDNLFFCSFKCLLRYFKSIRKEARRRWKACKEDDRLEGRKKLYKILLKEEKEDKKIDDYMKKLMRI
jgi:hypothetical protein